MLSKLQCLKQFALSKKYDTPVREVRHNRTRQDMPGCTVENNLLRGARREPLVVASYLITGRFYFIKNACQAVTVLGSNAYDSEVVS